MVIKCVSSVLTETQFRASGDPSLLHEGYPLKVGREYLVFALTIDTSSAAAQGGVWVSIQMEPKSPTMIAVPLSLFEIIDPRASRYWTVGSPREGLLRIWPAAFLADFYHDDLSERLPEAVNDFWKVQALLEAESREIEQKPRNFSDGE